MAFSKMKRKRKTMKTKLVVLLTSLVVLSSSCAINPVTGKQEISLISEQGEIELGASTDKEIRAQFGVYDNPELTEYVKKVGMALAPHTHRPHLTYHFAVLDTPVINAFAVPGGYIYVTRGILALMNSEAELAVVLGHELGHVNARHSVRKMSQMMLAQIGLALGGALSETFAKVAGIAGVGVQLLFLKFSRDDERQADQLGIEYARKGQYNPAYMVHFFHSLEAMGDLSGGQSLPGFLSTHPLTSERIKYAEEKILDSDRSLRYKQVPYLQTINTMVFGNDPRQGFTEENTYYHPQMRFFFSFPKGWKIQNNPSNVTLVTEDGNAAVILQVESSQEEIKEYAKKKASSIEGHKVLDEKSMTVNGYSTYFQFLDIPQQDKENLRMALSCIRKDQYIYSFVSLSTESLFNQYSPTFNDIVGSFKELTERRHLDRKPNRIALTKADGKVTLQSILAKNGQKKDLWPRLAVMNGMELDQRPEEGQLIKIVK
jgi:predicted Zn-dependent protease